MDTPEVPQPDDQDPAVEPVEVTEEIDEDSIVPVEQTPETDLSDEEKAQKAQNLIKALFGDLAKGDDEDEDSDNEVRVEHVVIDPSDPDSIEKALEDLPQGIKDKISEMISATASNVVDKIISDATQQLDRFADDIRKVSDPDGIKCEHHEGEVHSPMARNKAIGGLMHWLAEGSDMSRTELATMLGAAVGKMAEYQDHILELELASQFSTS